MTLGSSLANSNTSLLQGAGGLERMVVVHDEEELFDSVTGALKKLIILYELAAWTSRGTTWKRDLDIGRHSSKPKQLAAACSRIQRLSH